MNAAAAFHAAVLFAIAHGGMVVKTSGTPSMRPLITEAYVVVENVKVAQVVAANKTGDVLLYRGRPDANKPNVVVMLHRAVDRDRYGLIMSGDNNRWTENWDRVTDSNLLGRAVAIFNFDVAPCVAR